MPAYDRHVGTALEAVIGTYVAASRFYPVTELEIDMAQEEIAVETTGKTRGESYSWPGAIMPMGSGSMPFWTEYMGLFILASLFHDYTVTTPTGATTARLHNFLPDDDNAAFKTISVEAQHTPDLEQFLRGCVVNSFTITINNKGNIDFEFELTALDEVYTGQTWSDAASAPSPTASPTYFSGAIRPFQSFDVVLNIGDDVSQDGTAKNYTIDTPANKLNIESFTLEVNNNVSQRHGFTGQVNPRVHNFGKREVTWSMDVDWSTTDLTYQDLAKGGTHFPLEVIATGPQIEVGVAGPNQFYQLGIVLLNAVIPNAVIPPYSGDYGDETQTIEGKGLVHETELYDLDIYIVDTVADYTP